MVKRYLDFQGAGETAPLWVASSLTSPVNRLRLGFSHRPPSTLFTTDSANDSQLEVKHRHLEQWGLILSLGVPGPHIPTLTPANTRTHAHARARTHHSPLGTLSSHHSQWIVFFTQKRGCPGHRDVALGWSGGTSGLVVDAPALHPERGAWRRGFNFTHLSGRHETKVNSRIKGGLQVGLVTPQSTSGPEQHTAP